MTKYHITIQKIEDNVPYSQNVWHKLTDNEDAENQYGYIKEEGTKTIESDIYEQTVEKLDLSAVIVAVNGL